MQGGWKRWLKIIIAQNIDFWNLPKLKQYYVVFSHFPLAVEMLAIFIDKNSNVDKLNVFGRQIGISQLLMI